MTTVSARLRRTAIVSLIVLNLGSRLFLAARPLELSDGVTIPDDAYLSLHIARSIAAGQGPLYGNEHTNGFQPLYVLLMVPVYAVVDNPITPIHVALSLLALFDTLTLLLLMLWLSRAVVSPLTVGLVGFAWLVNPYVISNSLNGLETSIATFLLVACLAWFHRCFYQDERDAQPRESVVLGLLLGLAALARIDCVILGLCMGVVLIGERVWSGRPIAGTLRDLLLIGAGAMLMYAPWALYSYWYTGDVYPVSGQAVRFMSLANVGHAPTLVTWYLPMLVIGLKVVITCNMAYLSAGAIAMLALLGLRRSRNGLQRCHVRLLVMPMLFGTLLFLAYTLYIFADWFFPRYLYPISIVLLLGMAVTVDALLMALPGSAWQGRVVAAMALLICGVNTAGGGLQRIFAPADARNLGYMNVGLWAKRSFPARTVIGSSQSGALGYFADNLKVINLDGVVSRHCLESLETGHNLDYIRAQKIDFVIGWPVNLQFIANHSTGFRTEDLPVVGRIDEFRSWEQVWYVARVRY